MDWNSLKQNEDKLVQQVNKKSASKVARNCGVDHKTVTYWLDKYGYIYYGDEWVKESEIEEEIEEVIEDEEESKNIQVEEFDTYYHVFDKKQSYKISKQKLREIYKYYCEHGLTQDETCTKCNISTENFKLVKKVFGFVHNSIPYPDHEVENRPIEDLVDETLQRRKQKYEDLLQNKEMRRLKRIEKKYQEKNHFTEKLIESVSENVNTIDYRPPAFEFKTPNRDKVALIFMADWHYGKMVYGNEVLGDEEGFNEDILRRRVDKYTNAVIEKLKLQQPKKAIIVNTGDITDDPQAKTYEKQIYNQEITGIQQIFGCGDLVKDFIMAINDYVPEVDVLFLPGNHGDSVINPDITIGEHIKRLLEQYNINFDVSYKPFKLKKELGANLVFTHGENMRNGKNTGEVDRLNVINRLKLQKENTYLFQGHLHSEKEEGTGYEYYKLPSIVGNDDYNANQLNVFGRPAQMMFILTEEGLTDRRKVYFD